MAKCAYRGKRTRKIEEKWINDNVEDEEERGRKKENLNEILKGLGEKADCRLEAIPGGEFCIFHDPDYWKAYSDEVREEFLNHLERDKEWLFIGFHLPSIKLPKTIKKELHMELAKLHGALEAEGTTFKARALIWMCVKTMASAKQLLLNLKIFGAFSLALIRILPLDLNITIKNFDRAWTTTSFHPSAS